MVCYEVQGQKDKKGSGGGRVVRNWNYSTAFFSWPLCSVAIIA